jgi:predicted component of type VI protein secretion system
VPNKTTTAYGRQPEMDRMYRLTVEDAAGRLVFDRGIPPQGLTIGRLAPCEVLLKGTPVSRQHARVAYDEDGPFVTDLGSANGTFVDGNRIEADKVLDDRSLVEIGEYRLRVMEVREIRESGSFTIFVPPAETASFAIQLASGAAPSKSAYPSEKEEAPQSLQPYAAAESPRSPAPPIFSMFSTLTSV